MSYLIAALIIAAIAYAIYRTRASWLNDQSAPPVGPADDGGRDMRGDKRL